jgi:hypothetical protein
MVHAKRLGCLVAIFIVLVALALFAPVQKVYADQWYNDPQFQNPYTQTRTTYVQNLTDDLTNKNYSQGSYQLSAFTNFIGAAGTGLMGATTVINGQTYTVAQGVVPQMGNAMAYMIQQPPASAELWLADVLHNSPLLGQAAYAQGVGFQSLVPILPIWRTFRDLSYIAFIFAFIIVGFMIMFRNKLDGQTVATISNALPRMVVTLILITFSYAIAGFLIDLMYIVIYFICGVFVNLMQAHDLPALVQTALSKNILNNGLDLVFNGITGTGSSVAGNAAESLGNIVTGYFGNGNDFLTHAAKTILGDSVSVIGFLIFAIAIFFAVVKTFFELLKSYVTFVIMVIFSPFQLLFGMFKEGGDFGQWIRNLAATLVPFPVVIVMIFLAMVLGGKGIQSTQPGAGVGFQPPQITLTNTPQGGQVAATQGLIVIGLLMLLPESVELSKKWLKATSPFDEFLPKITKNLEQGWKGGQLIPGIGPALPGAQNLFGKGLQSAGGAGLGAIAGAGLGAYSQRGKGVGNIIAGGLVGGGGGAIVGGAAPIAAPMVTKAVERGTRLVETGRRAVYIGQNVQDLVQGKKGGGETERAAQQTVTQAQSVRPTTPNITPGDTGDA